MNPNSAHQHWSEWTFVVEAAGPQPVFADVQLPLSRFFTSVFGSTGRVKIEQALNVARARTIWTIVVQVEGESLYQAGWRQHVRRSFELSAARRFGAQATVTMEVRLLAGETENARPSAQWLILPKLEDSAMALGVTLRPPAQGLGVPAVPSGVAMWG